MAELFEAYFQRADLDRDGRISGAEAVAFFQGSGLPKNILAQIWSYSDKKNAGYLERPEFFNALKLATVAQTGRQLTPDIVKAALEGPGTARVPAPKINPAATPTAMNPASVQRPHSNNMLLPSTATSTMLPTSYQNAGFGGPQSQLLPNAGANLQMFPTGGSQLRPSQGSSASSSVQIPFGSQGSPGGGVAAGPRFPGSNIPNLSTDRFGSRNADSAAAVTAQLPTSSLTSSNLGGFGMGPANSSAATMLRPQPPGQSTLAPKALDPLATFVRLSGQDSNAPVVSGSGFASDKDFGNDVSSMSQPKQDALFSTFSASSIPSTTTSPPVPSGSQPKSFSAGSSQSLPATIVGGGTSQPSPSLTKQNQLDVAITMTPTSGPGTGDSGLISSQPQAPWPKMVQSNIQKYTKVFVEVDKDRDGRVTGEEARNLFLSWRLPREVLKKVWDLSDQDNDGMLSISEFCISLYLMERYREGRQLPSTLPDSLKFDDALLQITKQNSAAYGGLAWQASAGFSQQGALGVPPSADSAPAIRPQQQIQAIHNQFVGQMHNVQQNMAAHSLGEQPANQFSSDEQKALTGSKEYTANVDSKPEELPKEIMDSKEKLEYYRTKMQDLVLYKSRCDNKLNEITETSSSSKREMEDLAKRYEERYKQVGEIASKLTVEEATFRDIEERKLELRNAVTKMEQGGSIDGLLQVRADRIQSDLEELGKALNERCKKHGLDVKSTVVVELPFGWQPGIQEGAADWDEDWDKFEDEGFILSKDFIASAKNSDAPSRLKSSSDVGQGIFAGSVSPDSSTLVHGVNGESAYAHSESGSERSPRGSLDRSAVDSPTHEFHSTKFDNHDASPRDNGNDREHGSVDPFFSDDKYGESSWGAAFDAGDDADSVWGYNTTNKEFGLESSKHNSFFHSGDFGSNPTKIDTPTTSRVFGKEKSPFADSVPGTPSFSPHLREDRTSFESAGQFDTFGTHENFARFDSIRSSSMEFDQGIPFGQHDSPTGVDSMRNSRDSNHSRAFQSFDDADPFGTGPFKSSSSDTPKHSSDNWNAF